MAEKLNMSSDVGINCREAQPSEASQRQDADNCLRCQLSRTSTQPRGLYEAIIDTYGPMTAPDVLQGEASEVDQAYNSLQASCSSDAETCSSHEDGQEIYPDPVHDRKDGREAIGTASNDGRSSRTQRRNESQNRVEVRSDEDWAKSILSRPTGWGYVQRTQVLKYKTYLETSVANLQMEVLNLCPQVAILGTHRWDLRKENDTLKWKIADLTRSHLLKEDQISALQKELQRLRIQVADDVEQAQQEQEDTVLSSKTGLVAGHGDDAEARGDLPIAQEHSYDQTSGSDIQIREELGGLPDVSTESSREAKTGSNPSSNPSAEKELQADGKVSTQLSLVKWPSSLYRSVSAIRKDVLEVDARQSESRNNL